MNCKVRELILGDYTHRKAESCLVHDKNLVVNVDREVICLYDDVVLRIRVHGHGHRLCRRRVGLVHFNFLSSMGVNVRG
jgi:hypothetical protein